VKVTKEMLDLARHIVETKSGDFEPEKFEDRYENALVELLNQKRKGEPIRAAVKPRDTGNVVNLMDALRKSLSDVSKGASSQTAKGRKPKKAASGQREMHGDCRQGGGQGKGWRQGDQASDTPAQGGLAVNSSGQRRFRSDSHSKRAHQKN
jgi:DNA end-binding protein Ku